MQYAVMSDNMSNAMYAVMSDSMFAVMSGAMSAVMSGLIVWWLVRIIVGKCVYFKH